MHEMSLAESVREIVDETARASGAKRVIAVRLEIGKLAQVEIDAVMHSPAPRESPGG